ncbi:SCO family protein [Sedimenticola sp.]|uniref:SCO family protein n=1 Tax=Sedimenticola sp. TaxID=1940285 RepID=UPI003D14D3B4
MQGVVTQKSYWPMLLLILLFGLPPTAGWVFIMNPQWLPDKHKNRGVLVSPPRPLQPLALTDENDQPFDWNSVTGHWILIAHNRGVCETTCQQQLHALRQIRRAAGAERVRIDRLLIQDGGTTDAVTNSPSTYADGAKIVYLSADQQDRFNALFSIPGINQAHATYLADPNGMLMMGYAETSPTKDILKDLETLLKASRNWTTGVNHGNG